MLNLKPAMDILNSNQEFFTTEALPHPDTSTVSLTITLNFMCTHTRTHTQTHLRPVGGNVQTTPLLFPNAFHLEPLHNLSVTNKKSNKFINHTRILPFYSMHLQVKTVTNNRPTS